MVRLAPTAAVPMPTMHKRAWRKLLQPEALHRQGQASATAAYRDDSIREARPLWARGEVLANGWNRPGPARPQLKRLTDHSSARRQSGTGGTNGVVSRASVASVQTINKQPASFIMTIPPSPTPQPIPDSKGNY